MREGLELENNKAVNDILEEICFKKRGHVSEQKLRVSLNDLKRKCEEMPLAGGFCNALERENGVALIAEVKKASPSKGVIREDFDPVEIAQIYEGAGATCLSVLTDVPYFQGHDQYLKDVKKAVSLPVLRKDFIIDPYQIYESRALGADCILLIMAALSDSQAWEYYELATSLGLDVLTEVHDLGELERAKRFEPMMIGVNNRNLKTLEVDVQTSFDLMLHMPQKGSLLISESGISDPATIGRLSDIGYRGFLVGESLMRQDNIDLATRSLLGK